MSAERMLSLVQIEGNESKWGFWLWSYLCRCFSVRIISACVSSDSGSGIIGKDYCICFLTPNYYKSRH